MVLTLRQLRYFTMAVSTGSMTRAAELLHLAPPALSVQIKAMEEALGVRLLTRHSRGTVPTEAGIALHERALEILAMVETAEEKVRPFNKDLPRNLRIGVVPSALRAVGANALAAARTHLRGMDVYLKAGHPETLRSGLDRHDLDLVFAAELPTDVSIQLIELVEEDLVFATAAATARRPGGGRIAFHEVLASDLLFYADGCITHRAVAARAHAEGAEIANARFVGSSDLIRQMIITGDGTAVLPAGVVFREKLQGKIAIHQIDGPPFVRRLCLAWNRDQAGERALKRPIDFATRFIGNSYASTVPNARRLQMD